MTTDPKTAAFRVARADYCTDLEYWAGGTKWIKDSQRARPLSEEEAEQIAHDWNSFSTSKGYRSRYRAEPFEGVRFIDMKPTWTQAAQIIAAALENGTDKGRDAARAELFRMASILDQITAEKDNAQ